MLSPQALALCEALGAPYSWGAGKLSDVVAGWPGGVAGKGDGIGWDCSGFAQVCLMRLGIVRTDAWTDISAHDLANACRPVDVPALGDLAFYGSGGRISHVTVCLDARVCIGANGGVPSTNGNEPEACVQARPIRYRRDLVVIGALKEEYRR